MTQTDIRTDRPTNRDASHLKINATLPRNNGFVTVAEILKCLYRFLGIK